LELLSTFAFNFSLRRYNMIAGPGSMYAADDADAAAAGGSDTMVGRSMLAASEPVLKAPMVSAFVKDIIRLIAFKL